MINLAQLDLPFFLSEADRDAHRSITVLRYHHQLAHKTQHDAALDTILPLLEHRQYPGDGHIEDTFCVVDCESNEE